MDDGCQCVYCLGYSLGCIEGLHGECLAPLECPCSCHDAEFANEGGCYP